MEAYVILGWVVEKPTKQVRLRSSRHDGSGAGTAHQAVRQQDLLSNLGSEEKRRLLMNVSAWERVLVAFR